LSYARTLQSAGHHLQLGQIWRRIAAKLFQSCCRQLIANWMDFRAEIDQGERSASRHRRHAYENTSMREGQLINIINSTN
jgi:hypothetical protein